MAGAYSSSLVCKAETHSGQDALPLQDTLTHSHPHSLRLGQFKHTNSSNLHIFGIWEETELPGENPCRHGENVQTPHRQ